MISEHLISLCAFYSTLSTSFLLSFANIPSDQQVSIDLGIKNFKSGRPNILFYVRTTIYSVCD